ncbi:MAG: outer membrane beta-barrel protein [Bacteroidales bacterium]|nr:outer membrane beta-barrel protein [Bacteroidales bacterium]
MKRFLSIALLLVVSLLLSASMSAQSNHKVKVTLKDATTGDPVSFATVSISKKESSASPKYILSDENGVATLEKIKSGTYVVKAELLGYVPYSSDVVIKDEDIDLGEINMQVDQELLDAASVSAVGNAIVIKKDTIEYNASSFKTTDNDMLLALLKKLPGVEVDENGTITANGENITKIYIDGKTFFMDDPQLATQNIPAKMVEKVKVLKKKSEQAEFSGIDDGQEETVIDLSVQPSMMDGLFANVMAGGGHDFKGDISDDPFKQNDGWRFQSNAMIGNFKKDSQISIILNANNANSMGFNDISGGMMRGMQGGMGGMAGMGGMGMGRGLTTSWMGGVNGALDLLDDRMELSGNYLYNGSNTITGSDESQTTYMTDGSSLLQKTLSNGLSTSGGHRFGIRLEHKFSDNTSILFEPQINFGDGSFNNTSNFTTNSSLSGLTNDGWSSSNGANKNWATNGRFLFRQRLGLPGRTLTVNLNWRYSDNKTESFNQSRTNNYFGGNGGLDRLVTPSIVNQRNEQLSTNSSLGARLEFTEPMGNNFYLSANYSYDWSQNRSAKDTYNSGAFDIGSFTLDNLIYYKKGETHDDVYSNNIYNRYINQQAGVNMMYQSDNMRAQIGFSAMPRYTYNETNGKVYEEKAVNWAPNASIFADFSETSNLRLFYSGRSSQPSTSQLMPVMDNSNPLRMSLGNPYLTSYFNHSLRGDYGYTNRQNFFSMRFGFNGSVNQNPIVNAIWYDQSNVQYSFPINGKPTVTAGVSFMLNTPLGDSNFRISNNTNVNYNASHSYVGATNLDMSDYFNDKKEFNYEKFHEDYFSDHAVKDFNKNFLDNKTQSLNVMENLRLTYRTDYIEATVGARTRVQKPWYTVDTNQQQNTTWTNTASASFIWTIGDSGFGINMNGDYNWYNGYSTNPENNFILNCELSKQLFNNNATLALRGYDLLNQTKSLSVSDTANYHNESRAITLGRYVIVSLTFRFGTFGRGRMGGGRGMGGGMRGMGGGMRGMGGGMPPMGGPGMGGPRF